ncbi:MAG: hypothetical protein WCN21_11830, partial [Comamonadaceae bacterium]
LGPHHQGQRLSSTVGLLLRIRVVIAGLTRNPVVAWHWIPDQVRDDGYRVRDDKSRCPGTTATESGVTT